jgi:ribosomal protein S12 methylthiotransferase
MPLQHISDRMLRAMRREKSGDGIRQLLDRIRTQIPGVVLRTSFIVGFPGEEEEDFQQLLDFVDEAQIDHVGVFRYSQEEGTAAGTLLNQVPDEVKQKRWRRLMERQTHVVRRKNLALIGSEQNALVCGQDDRGRLWGRTSGQAPDIDGVVFLDRTQAESGEIIPVHIRGVSGYDLRATPLPTQKRKITKPIDFADRPL